MRDDSNDVDDAFQATFLILVRKAQSIRNHGSLGIWLYGVAHRVALKATHAAARRRGDEGRRAEMTSERVRDREHDDIEPMLLDEVNRLSEKYRAANRALLPRRPDDSRDCRPPPGVGCS